MGQSWWRQIRLQDLVLAARPKTLTAAFVPVLVGTALAMADGYPLQVHISLIALLSALCIQVGTNFVNDAIDFKKGADSATRIGPARLTLSGRASPQRVFNIGFAFFFVAFLLGLPLVWYGGWVIVVIGLLSLLFGYAYTGGPFPLAYLGLGDFFVILFFGGVAVGGIYYLQTSTYSWGALVAGLQVGFLATVLIAINNLRDREEDMKVAKKTMAVRLGVALAKVEIYFLSIVPFFLLLFWFWQGYRLAAVLPLVVLALVIPLIHMIRQAPPGLVYNEYLARAALIHALFGLQLALGLSLQ